MLSQSYLPADTQRRYCYDALVLLLVCVFLIAGCSKKAPAPPRPPV